LLPILEAELAPFEPRPHWGKLFTIPVDELQSSYERLDDFRGLLSQYDPDGKFRNRFLDEWHRGVPFDDR
jgi:xylitol oxidase